jgi:hypothetical protein
VKRTADGIPLPSPKTKLRPLAVVTRKLPRRIADPNAHRINPSIGELRLIDAIPTGTTGEGFQFSPKFRRIGPGASLRRRAINPGYSKLEQITVNQAIGMHARRTCR